MPGSAGGYVALIDTPSRPTIHALTGLRFVAALLVVLSHFPELVPFTAAHEPLVRQGAAGVTIFFVLSGLVLTYNYFDRFAAGVTAARAFLWARLARIGPMHVVAHLLITPLVIAYALRPSVLSWFVNISMLHAFVPTKSMHLWNIPSWSISAELCFYCVFPFFIWRVLARVQRRHLPSLGLIVFAIECALFAAVAVVLERALMNRGKSPADVRAVLERVKFFPGLRIWEFFLGCTIGAALVYWQRDGGTGGGLGRRRNRNALLLCVAGAATAILMVPSHANIGDTGLLAQFATAGLYVAYTPLAVALVAALAWGPTAVSGGLEHRFVRAMGDASYSFYMLQWVFVIVVNDSAIKRSSPSWWSAMATVAVLLVVSLLTHRWVEQPARRALNRRCSGLQQAAQ